MSGHAFRIIARRAGRSKSFTFINLLGLMLGITVCLFIAQFVYFEHSFEDFNPKVARTYRINLYNTQNGVFDKISPATVSGLAYAMEQTLPGIEATARISQKTKGIVANPQRQIEAREDQIVYADPAIVEMLALEMIDGNPQQLLQEPQSIVISQSAALKYFRTTAAVGQALELGFNGNSISRMPYVVQGVFHDIPANSHQHVDFILPAANAQAWNENWAWSDVYTYVRLRPEATSESLETGLAAIVRDHHQDKTGDRYLLEPLSDIRLHALDGSGRSTLINFFTALGAVILLLAWFNYINLATAQFLDRMKEVGVRKIVGASRIQLVLQFLSESLLFHIVSLCGALLVFALLWEPVATMMHMTIPQTLLSMPGTWGVIPGLVAVSTLISGIYPALFLSSFKPMHALKGNLPGIGERSTLRKILVVVQLSVSVMLLTAIFALQRQITHMQDQDTGLSMDGTLIIEEPLLTDNTTADKFESFKHETLQLPAVQGVTYASSFPGSEIDWHRTDITLGAENTDYRYDSRIISIGTEFLDVFGLPLLSGRNFDPQRQEDNRSMLINQEAYKMFGFHTPEEALNKLVFVGSRRFEIIGVVKNHHFRSLQHGLQPVLYMQGYPRNPAYAVKLHSAGIAGTMKTLESIWKTTYAGNAFSYYFLDERFADQYGAERQAETLVGVLAVLALVISSMGLLGLSMYAVSRRMKEIGIRKIFGATVANLMMLLSRDFVMLALGGGILGVAVVYQGIAVWLEGYAYPMPLNIGLFAWPVAAVITLTLFTVSFQTVTAARRNPAESIKND
jgi:putative ABC transport system permease protein